MWWCLAKVSVPLLRRLSWIKYNDCVFIDNTLNSSAYRFLVHKSEILDIHVNMIIESRNDVFFENAFPYKREKKHDF